MTIFQTSWVCLDDFDVYWCAIHILTLISFFYILILSSLWYHSRSILDIDERRIELKYERFNFVYDCCYYDNKSKNNRKDNVSGKSSW